MIMQRMSLFEESLVWVSLLFLAILAAMFVNEIPAAMHAETVNQQHIGGHI